MHIEGHKLFRLLGDMNLLPRIGTQEHRETIRVLKSHYASSHTDGMRGDPWDYEGFAAFLVKVREDMRALFTIPREDILASIVGFYWIHLTGAKTVPGSPRVRVWVDEASLADDLKRAFLP